MPESTPDSIYFYMAGDDRRGPFSLEQMLQQPIHRDTPLWKKGTEAWTTVGQIPELVEHVPPPPPVGGSRFRPGLPAGRTGDHLERHANALRRLNIGMLYLIAGTVILGIISNETVSSIAYIIVAIAWLVMLWHAAEAVPVKRPWVWAIVGVLPLVGYVPLIMLLSRLKQPLLEAGYRISFLGKATPPAAIAT